MATYETLDGRVRVFSTRVRSEWHRRAVRRGALVTLWHAYNVPEDHWIAREHFTLRSIKKTLTKLGYCASQDCRLQRMSE